jgi:hypothetical protein
MTESDNAANSAQPHRCCDNFPLVAHCSETRWEFKCRCLCAEFVQNLRDGLFQRELLMRMADAGDDLAGPVRFYTQYPLGRGGFALARKWRS